MGAESSVQKQNKSETQCQTKYEFPHISVNITTEQLTEGISQVLQEIKPTWNLEKLTTKTSPRNENNGLLNTMVTCFVEEHQEDSVMMRIYGESGVEEFLNRDAEVRGIQMIKEKYDFVPNILATFENGFCYKYITGDILGIDKVGKEPVWRIIATQLGQLHALPCKSFPFSKSKDLLFTVDSPEKPYPESLKNPEQDKIFQSAFPKKVEMMKLVHEAVEAVKNDNNILVFSHGDLKPENMVWNQQSEKVTFVDFEGLGIMYQPNDIAYHFWRYSALTSMDLDLFPSDDFQRQWLRVYLENYFSALGGEKRDVTDTDVQRLFVQVQHFLLLQLIQFAKMSGFCDDYADIPIDMMAFCRSAMEGYRKLEKSVKQLRLPEP